MNSKIDVKNKWKWAFFIFIFLFLDLVSANNTGNITIEENKIVEKNYNYSYCIDLLSSKEDILTGWVGIIGINKFAWSTYGDNSYFSWINIPDGLSAPREYGCKWARTISYGSRTIPLEAISINNSLNAYGINVFDFLTVFDFPLQKYVNVERGYYQLLNESVENLHRISLQRLCTSKNDDVNWYLDTLYSSKSKHLKERPKFSFKWNYDENDKKKILDYLNLHDIYLFSWEDISRNDTNKILEILKVNFGFEFLWIYDIHIDDVEIKKINNEKINITDGEHWITFTLKKKEKKVIVEIFGKYYEHSYKFEYLLKEENGVLKVYEKVNEKILKDKNNKNIFIIEKIGETEDYIYPMHTIIIGLRENEAVLKHCVTGRIKSLINLSKITDKEYILNFLDILEGEIIKIEPLDNNIVFIRAKFNNSGFVEDYLVVTKKYDKTHLVENKEYDKEYVSYILEFIDMSKFEVKNESGELKIYEFESPYQYIDAFYNIDSRICFEYSDDGKEGKINFENKTIDWEIKEGIENESCENNTLKIKLEGGKDIRFFPFLITKNITKEKNETMIYGILTPCNLSEFYNLGLTNGDKTNMYVNKVLLSEGISFSSMFKIMLALYYEKIPFDGCGDTKNYTLIFKFSDKFDKKDIKNINIILTKILPEEEPYGTGRVGCIEKEMKC